MSFREAEVRFLSYQGLSRELAMQFLGFSLLSVSVVATAEVLLRTGTVRILKESDTLATYLFTEHLSH